MFGKMPRLLMTSIASILLAACGVGTMDAMPSETEEMIEAVENESEAELNADVVEETETEPIEAEVTSEQVEDSAVAEETKETEIVVNELHVKNQERALNQLLLETHLEKEAYSYYFNETDSLDFIEIEVREIQEDSEHAPLEGVYRYIIETEEIVMRDYLTGDFIPYVITE